MRPRYIDDLGWAMAEVYEGVTNRILLNLAHHFPYIKAGHEPRGSFEYQARMLAQMGQINKETMAIIADSLGGADAALRDALEKAIMDALRNEEPALQRAAKQGLTSRTPPEPELSPNQMQAFRSFYRQSADKLNLVNTVMLESTQAAYQATVSDIVQRVQRTQSIVNTAAGEAVTGVSTWNKAMHDAVQKMAANGLTGFVDHAGRHWSPEAYVAMDIRTTLHNTANAAIWERADEYGADIYQVSSHNGARPLCAPWQYKLVSRTGSSRDVPDLDGNMIHVYAQSETSYGEPAGLFGINCGHYPMTFIPGFSTLKGRPQGDEENERTYEESQQQRALERDLRQEKLKLDMLRAQGATQEEIDAQKAKVRQASDDIQAFCDETGRARRRNREYTPTNASFPPEDSYDVATFPTDVRDQVGEWFNQSNTTLQAVEAEAAETQAQTAPEFKPASTVADAEEYAQRFAGTVNYYGLSVEECNEVNQTLYDLYNKYPNVRPLDSIEAKTIKANAASSFNELDLSRNGIALQRATMFELNKKMATYELDALQHRYEGVQRIPRRDQEKMERLEQALRFQRWSVAEERGIRGALTHEFGHIIADQFLGQINRERATANYNTPEATELRQMIVEFRQQSFDDGFIYDLSKYGASDEYEFFAEIFCAHEYGEELPDYLEELIDEVVWYGSM